jgi:hypothetical protein
MIVRLCLYNRVKTEISQGSYQKSYVCVHQFSEHKNMVEFF